MCAYRPHRRHNRRGQGREHRGNRDRRRDRDRHRDRRTAFPGHSQILSRSCGENLGEGLVPTGIGCVDFPMLCSYVVNWFVRIPPSQTQSYSRTGNGGLGFVMTRCPRNMRPVQAFANSYGLREYQVANEGRVDVSGRFYSCTSTEESSRLRASASLKISPRCTRTTILKEAQSQG